MIGVLTSLLIASVDAGIHEKCIDAKDYSGCVKMNERPESSPDDLRAWQRSDGDIVVFDPKSVNPMTIKGSTGRYLSYRYTLTYWDPGFSGIRTPIVSSTTVSGSSYYTTITGGQLIGARAAGPSKQFWTVECDCKDYTANWSGDFSGWIRVKEKGQAWAKEAVLIMDEFCPKLDHHSPPESAN
jgi:hypothetical protein